MDLKQLKHKYEMIPEAILEECWEAAQKELLIWWIEAFEQGAYSEKEALELMKDQLKETLE